jgi:blue copper oxidase
MPDQLANLEPADPSEATYERQFTLQMGEEDDLAALAFAWDNLCGEGQGMAINGRPMKMDRINQRGIVGRTEIWRIKADEEIHPFHVHGCSFRILQQESHETVEYARGWKDIVHVQDGVAEILVRFDHEAPDHAPYMYHCHILEHEDCGMMGQIAVEPAGA